jgi:hypothetical protein
LNESGDWDIGDIHFFLPPGAVGRKIRNNLSAILLQHSKSGRRKSPPADGIDAKMRLDID